MTEQAGQVVDDVEQAGRSAVTTVPPLTVGGVVQTIPPAVRPTFSPLEVQTIPPAAVGQTMPPVAVQVNTPDIQIGVSDSSHVYVLCPDGSVQMVPAEEEQTVLRAVGKTASNLTDGQQGQYGGSLFSTEGAAGSYALTALCAFLGAAASLPLLLPAIPMGPALYFALKHLLLPDVEMGIIRVMRPYNACVILLGLSQAASLLPGASAAVRGAGSVLVSLLLAGMLPVAETGVRKWFM